MRLALRQEDFSAVKALQQVEHRPVVILEEPPRDRDVVIRSDCNEILVKRAVVNRAEAQSVRNSWFSEHFCIAGDVRGIQ